MRHLCNLKMATKPAGTVKADFKVSTAEDASSELLTIKRSHLDLAVKANGKAELYWHAYFWVAYVEQVAA